ILHILANRNNTHATFTNPKGLILATATAGNLGLRKAARGTSDAGYQTVAHLAEKKYHGVDLKRATEEGIHMKFSGFGPGRDQAFRAIVAAGWKINMITDVTPFAHGGCRPRKKRRL
ncbi:uncharacterized protein EV422DRAFT_491556, partial [Fimicolochytrium jonesii]|uniref:uncharacterized protein n=1 Tax=Fimicolochytrium jonesii TaxID=1396493 RepID=UPI0022FE2DE2